MVMTSQPLKLLTSWWSGAALGLAIVVAVKIWLLWQIPLCVYSEDSGTYFRTVQEVDTNKDFTVSKKRSFAYPMLLISLNKLPVRSTWSILLVQHIASLLTPIAVVALLRRWWPQAGWMGFPAALMAGLSVPMLFYSHYMIADGLYAVVFSLYMLCAWLVLEKPEPLRVSSLFLCCAVAVALRPDGMLLFGAAVILTLAGLAISRPAICWKVWIPAAALPAALCVSFYGKTASSQQGWLFYSTMFPLTVLDSPLHADLKTELRPWVEKALSLSVWDYPEMRHKLQGSLSGANEIDRIGPKWEALVADKENRPMYRVSGELAAEGVKNNPAAAALLAASNVRHVWDGPRKLHGRFSVRSMAADWLEEMDNKPDLIPYWFKSDADYRQIRAWLETQERYTPAREFMKKLEPLTSPRWWSLAGVLMLGGYLALARKDGCRALFFCGMWLGFIYIIYAIGRGIPRYMLPIEMMWPLGLFSLAGAITARFSSAEPKPSRISPENP